MPVSSVTEHWIKQDALTINLNHFGDPDYLQVSVLAGAVVMAFKQDVIGYNAAHNYRTWPLQAANTYLETSSAVNVYARLTRSEVNASALIVYDPVLRDIEGREISYAEDGSELLGDSDPAFFYVFVGQITESLDSNGNKKPRDWNRPIIYGTLDSSEQKNYAGLLWEMMFTPHFDDPLNPDELTWIEAKKHIGVVGGISMFVNNGKVNLPSIYDGLPIDRDTIYWDAQYDDEGNVIGKVLKAKGGGGTGGVDEDAVRTLIESYDYATKDFVRDYVLQNATGGEFELSKQMVIDALGFTPYSAENPNGYITAASIPSALKNPYALTFGSKTYDGSATKSITAGDLGAALSSDLSKYLPLSGGTVSNATTTPLTVNSTNTEANLQVSVGGSGKALFGYKTGVGTWMRDSKAYNIVIGDDGVLKYGLNNNLNTIWHAGNDGSGSGLDADLLDGVHASSLMRLYVSNDNVDDLAGNRIILFNGIVPPYAVGTTQHWGAILQWSSASTQKPSEGSYYFQLWGDTQKEHLWYRVRVNGNAWKATKQIAFITDNVASATKLQTARQIWGQSFDGTGDVTGNFYMGNNININGADTSGNYHSLVHLNNNNVLYFGYGTTTAGYRTIIEGNDIYFRYKGHTVGMVMSDSGNVGIGTTSPAYKLDVNGTVCATELLLRRSSDNATNLRIYSPSSSGHLKIENQSGSGNILFTSNVGGKGLVDVMCLYGDKGYVGIGTPSPSAKLHVVGGANPIMCESTAEESSIYFVGSGSGSAYKWAVGKGVWGLSGKFGIGEYNTKKALYMQIGIDGNVGIGVPYTANPSAKLHVVGDVKSEGNIIGTNYALCYESNNPYLKLSLNNVNWYVQAYDGYMYLGKGISKSVRIDLEGNILSTGGVTMQSQRSLKNVVDEIGLSLTDLSAIKPTRFKWKDKRDDRIHFGGIADDIEKVLPEVIYTTSDGTLTMDYGNAGFAIASSLIKPVVDHDTKIIDHDTEIRMLKIRVKELEEELKRYSA